MAVIFKSKISPWANVFPQIENIIANPSETPFCVGIPYGLQLQKEIWNPEKLRVVLHVNTASGHSFLSHHGVGKKNEINIWNFSKEKQPGNSANALQSISTDFKFLHILFVQRRRIYVMNCTDLSLRIFSAKFHPLSTIAVNKTVLSLAYNEIRDEIITGIAGGIMTWKFPTGQTDPLIPGQLISCSFTPFDWVMSLTVDNTSRQILAISDFRISMIDIATHKERCSFEKKCDFSFTTCVFYSPASYFITGDKNGSVRAWSMSLNSFPMVTQFLGHTAEITKLLVHPNEPLLVSSSLDKTIRIWNFDTSAQTFKLETVEEIIDMELLSNNLLYYRSDHHLKIWSLNLFHSLFTVLSSRIRRWSRVKSPGYPARLLVHNEDGGVRLISPVHGYELTTVLPITTMTADIVDVAHNPRQEKIYLLLSTREVLVFESDTNPCCAHQLWAAQSPDEGVCSLAMINTEFALDESSNPLKSGLLFAGHFNGQISLISGKDVYMEDNVRAHQGQVTFLRVSASFTKSHDSLATTDHLVSCGTDCTVRIWQLISPELNHVSIQQKALVKLLQPPRDLAMAGNTLCMAMADNNVVMCRVRAEEKRCGANIFNKTKETYEFLTHSKDEGHIAPINGLSCCSTLRLFATSSEDHSVKIWNCDNQLVREMSFDESLCGVCFANSRGDILVGFQSHISLVTILNYLPLPYLEILSKMHFDNDPFEDQVQFDDLLKFWYDPARVPRMPLEASKRRPLEPSEVERAKKKRKVVQSAGKAKKETVTIKPKQQEKEDLDLFQKRRQSRRLSTQVYVRRALRRFSAKSSTSSLSDVANAMKELVKDETKAKSEPQEKTPAPTVLGEEEAVAEVYWPFAPDGFIPNSVVRKRVTAKRPPTRLIPRITRPELKQEKLAEEEDEENDQFKPTIKDFWTLWRLMRAAHVKEKMSKESSRNKEQKKGRKTRKVSQSASSTLGRRLPPRPRAARSEGPLMELEEEEEEERRDKEKEYITEEEEELEPEEEDYYFEEVSDASPESSHEWSGSKLLETPKEILQGSEEEENLYFEDIDESQSSSSDTGSTKSVMKITSPETPFLTRILRKYWYPKLAQRRREIPKADDVIDNMLKVLPKMNSLRAIQDICKEFMNVEREFGISEDKKLEIQNILIKLSYDKKAECRQAAVRALGEMEVHRKDAYLTVVRRLVDTDEGTREEAKKVLKTLTGVDTMEGLSELIINMGVVHLHLPSNDNAVLMELAVRLREEKTKKQENMGEEAEADKNKGASFDNLRRTLRRRPFKAKLRHPKTMDRRLRDNTRRRPSVFDEPATLSNTGRFQKALKESKLGCKLLQKMEPFGLEMAKGLSEPTSREQKEAISLEIGGERLAPSQYFKQGEELTQLVLDREVTPIIPNVSVTPVKSSDRLTITRERETITSLTGAEVKSVKIPDRNEQQAKETTATPGCILLEPEQTRGKYDTDQATEGLRSTELLSLKQILQVMNCVTGLSQNSNMLLLLKMKRTKRIAPQNIAQEDGTVQQFYDVGDLLEAICRLPPVSSFLAQLARKTSKSKEKIVINMRGIFRPGSLITMKRDDFLVINGLGRLPSKCQDTLITLRGSILQNIDSFLRNVESLTSGNAELMRTFTSSLEGILWACAILEPEMEMKGLFSVSQEGVQMPGRRTKEQYIGPRTSLESSYSARNEPQFPPIFLQPSLHYCVGPGTPGQRLLDSTLIRTRAMSDSRLQSSERKTKDFVVTSLPHRLSTHTGKQIEGKSQFGIMELTWRAGTPLRQLNEETPYNCETGNLPPISSKSVELKEPFILKNDQGKTNFKPHISKSQSVPLLSHRKVKLFAEKKLNFFGAMNSLNKQDSPTALGEYIQNQNIIKTKFLDEKGNLPPGSFTDHPPPPKKATPIPFHASSALPSLNKESMTSVRSGNSSGRCLPFYELSRGLTRDLLLSELNRFHLPPIFKDGRQNRSL